MSSTTCITFGCLLYKLTTKNLSTTKFVFAGASLLAGVVLCALVKFSLKSHNINNRGISNSIVIVIASTVFFEISPTIISTIVANATGKFLTDYVGPYAVTFSAINITLCATIYTTACKKAFSYSPANNNNMVFIASKTMRRSTTHA
uniref:Uncharacterized protein n=1 Tax=Panagrolaimus davidi TaxID=227884 RepID=A0A914PAN2_9BILA